MIMKKIVLTAANGFLGQHLLDHLSEKYEVLALVRKPKAAKGNVRYAVWDGETAGDWQLELEGAYAVINLAGRSVDCRYNEKNKRDIYASRLNTTRLIGEAIESCVAPPRIWLNAASATIYRHSLDLPMMEATGEYGTGFSVDVCQQWEKTFFEFAHPELRQVALRTTIVLGADGGAFVPLLRLVKVGLGGTQGRGDQMFSWIHVDDFCRAIEFVLDNETLSGPVNVGAPFPEHNRTMMRLLRKAYGRSFGLNLGPRLLEFGARLIKTETELIVKSRYVVPEKLLQAGFEFQYPRLEIAFPALVKRAK